MSQISQGKIHKPIRKCCALGSLYSALNRIFDGLVSDLKTEILLANAVFSYQIQKFDNCSFFVVNKIRVYI